MKLTLPVTVTVEKPSVARGEPIRLHLRLTNTLGRTLYSVRMSPLADWGIVVDWLGPDGHSPAQAAQETATGERALAPPGGVFTRRVDAMAPGEIEEDPAVSVDQLFGMSRPGVYSIRASRRVLLGMGREFRMGRTFTSLPVLVRVHG